MPTVNEQALSYYTIPLDVSTIYSTVVLKNDLLVIDYS